MTDEPLSTKIQMKLAIAFFIVVVYPIKHIFYPITRIIYENIYAVACVFLMWVTFFVVGSPSEVDQRLKERIISEHITMDWMIYPIFTINGFEINIFTTLTIILFCLLLYRVYEVSSQLWALVKMWAGHILMLSLWGWFTLIGDKKNSMLCLKSPSEKRSLLIFYAFVLICILFVIGMYTLQGHLTDMTLHIMNASHFTNESLETSSNMTVIPVNISLGSMGDIL